MDSTTYALLIKKIKDVEVGAIAPDVINISKDVVLVQPEEPTEEVNKIWVNSDTVTETVVPTYEEFIQGLLRKINEPQTEGTNGQVLVTDGNGGRSWRTVSGSGSFAVDDVQINGNSILVNGTANIVADLAPAEGSTNLITSGAVYAAINGIEVLLADI